MPARLRVLVLVLGALVLFLQTFSTDPQAQLAWWARDAINATVVAAYFLAASLRSFLEAPERPPPLPIVLQATVEAPATPPPTPPPIP